MVDIQNQYLCFRRLLQGETRSNSSGTRLSDVLSYSEFHLLQEFKSALDYEAYLHFVDELGFSNKIVERPSDNACEEGEKKCEERQYAKTEVYHRGLISGGKITQEP